jgi:hypothetical protein
MPRGRGRGFMDHGGLKPVLGADFRASQQYELVVFDRLPREQQDMLRDLTKDPDFYGVLLPRETGRGIKSVCRDTALLFLTLTTPGPLPSYVRAVFGDRSNQAIAGLVLDGVLEIGCGGQFASGAEAYDLIYEQRAPLGTARSAVPQLAREALQYAQALDLEETGPLSARLYFYNRVPLSPLWWRRFPSPEAVAAYLGADAGGANRAVLDQNWSKVDLPPPMDGWFQWRLRAARPPEERTGQTFKLYISPRPEFAREAFDAVLRTLTQTGAAPQFKIGNDAAGLLRPDKMVAYFRSRELLRKTAEHLAERLKGCAAQGVPFTAAVTEDGLLSWGVDPLREKGALTWQERESWRLWITNRLASALVTAKRTPGGGLEPWQFAMERLRLEGVDTETWTPAESFGRAEEAGAR